LQAETDYDKTIAQRVVLTDEAAFHTSVKVNRHNLRVLGYGKSCDLGVTKTTSEGEQLFLCN
jgi:hypothetical protein